MCQQLLFLKYFAVQSKSSANTVGQCSALLMCMAVMAITLGRSSATNCLVLSWFQGLLLFGKETVTRSMMCLNLTECSGTKRMLTNPNSISFPSHLRWLPQEKIQGLNLCVICSLPPQAPGTGTGCSDERHLLIPGVFESLESGFYMRGNFRR